MKKNFWWIVFWAIVAISYVILLYLVIAFPQDKDSLERFIIMNIGLLCTVPYGIAKLRGQVNESEEKEKKSESKKKGKYWKRLLVYTVISTILTVLIGLLPALTFKELIAIFISIILCLVILDFFYDFLPKKLGIED